MEEILVQSQCGLSTVLAGQKTLHSRYNPLSEAERYVDSLNTHGGIEYVILAECCLCYLIEPLRKKFPLAKIISIHISGFYGGKSAALPDAEWLPTSAVSRSSFLENEIDDTEADKIKIIEWRPAADVYGNEYLNLIKDITAFVKRADANKRTQAALGRRWIKNIVKNCFLFADKTVITRIRGTAPSCAAIGAGPDIEDSYGAIKNLKKNGTLIIAVSSASCALINAGIRPDVIIACDGGNWAPQHLFESLRFFYKKTPPVLAFSLNAALPRQCSAFRLLPVCDGSLFQNLVQKCFDIPCVSFPQRGTVGATALDLAFLLSDGPVYTAGINFSHKDIRTHAKPYAFDRILFSSADRLHPVYGLQFERAGMINSSGVNKIYAEWFAGQKFQRKIYPLAACNIDYGARINTKADMDIFEDVKKDRAVRPVTRLAAMLDAALNTGETREKLTKELSGLLSNDNVRAEMIEIHKKYCNIEARVG
ncbi:MAG: DUF115 domain-containing protein [Spirochaetaceae bacterium]|jgi:hypothetical protein|nr:DUF115 domain-containing protein [Spirochaetaceae bacterium]